MGRTADQRSWYRAVNKGWIHPDHTEPHQVHCWIPNVIPHYPDNSSHIVQPRNDINFVVSFRHIGTSSLCICECNTGTVCNVKKLTYWLSTYKKTFTRRFDTRNFHERQFYIWNYSRINQYRTQRQEIVAFFSFKFSHPDLLNVSSLYETMSINNSTVFFFTSACESSVTILYIDSSKGLRELTLSVYIEREMPITKFIALFAN